MPIAAPVVSRRLAFTLGLCAMLASITCADGGTAPPAVSSIEVESQIGNRVAVGRTATLIASALDASGNLVSGVAISWSSSSNGVATVSASGVVTAVSTGSVTITATGNSVSGTIVLQVRAPDFAGITASVADPYLTTLAANLTSAVRTRTQTAFTLCTAGVTTGNFGTVEQCISQVRAEVAGATDQTDRPVLATIALFVDHIERLLNL